MGLVFRLFLIATGIYIFFRLLFALARRKMVEVYSVAWVFLSLFFLLTGIVVHPYGMQRIISWQFFILIMLVIWIGVEGFFRISEHQSDLFRKNAELAMQISLLNEENQEVRRSLASLERDAATRKTAYEETENSQNTRAKICKSCGEKTS
ncbi:MAG: DUF2304 domain-containing protein [Bilifractor sp.]